MKKIGFLLFFTSYLAGMALAEPFMYRSFKSWESQAYGLTPVFRHLQHKERNWEKIREVADILSHETSPSSLQATLGRYFVILAERALNIDQEKDDLKKKTDHLRDLKASLTTYQSTIPKPIFQDIMQTLDFEINCHKYALLGKYDNVIDEFNEWLNKNPNAKIAPDIVKKAAGMFIEKHNYNLGIAFLSKIARKFKDYPRLRFEAYYYCSVIEARMIQTSPKALWFCRQAIKSTTDTKLIERAETRLHVLGSQIK